MVIDPGETPLKEKELLTEEKYRAVRAEYGHKFVAKMGAEAIKELLRRVEPEEMRRRAAPGDEARPPRSRSG